LRLGDFSVRVREDLQAIRDNRLTTSYPKIKQISDWNRFYKVINAASVFIENAGKVLEKDPAYSEINYQYDAAQARALRALAYFYMVRMWGDVPLITHSYDNGTFPLVARTEAQQVLNYAKRELLSLVTLLPELLGSSSDQYYGGDANKWKGWLINRYSVYALLTHIAAWEGNYTDVEAYAGHILNNLSRIGATYVTTENLVSPTGIFSRAYGNTYKASRLVTFGYEYNGTNVNESSVDGHLESWTLAEPITRKALPDIYVSVDSLLRIFMQSTTSDTRFGLDENVVPVRYYKNYVTGMYQDIPIFSKVKVLRAGQGDFGMFDSFMILSRVEDIALLRAEALCMLNRGEDAITWLNTVRAQRNLRAYSYTKEFASSSEALLKVVFEERRRELMGEGHYWFDQVRRAKALGDNLRIVELLHNGGIYWPVSDDVIKSNPRIEQTEYWK
jgi:hypothetical protein